MGGDDPHRPLRDDVRLLGRLLGETLQTHGDPGLFETVERVRMLSKASRAEMLGRYTPLGGALQGRPVTGQGYGLGFMVGRLGEGGLAVDDGKPKVQAMQFKDGWLWFATSGAVYRARDKDNDGVADDVETVIAEGKLPKDGGHWFRSLLVTDDGQGLESAERASGGAHFGLQGVRERVDKLGGVLEIDSSPGAGTRLVVTIPARLESQPLSHAQLSEI